MRPSFPSIAVVCTRSLLIPLHPLAFHPPPTQARAFSHLLLLTPDGRQAYHGPMAEALPYFQSLGYVPYVPTFPVPHFHHRPRNNTNTSPPLHTQTHTQKNRHRLPPACNPCDFFLELVSKTPQPPGASPLHSPIHQQQLQLQLFSSPSAGAHGGEEKDEELG